MSNLYSFLRYHHPINGYLVECCKCPKKVKVRDCDKLLPACVKLTKAGWTCDDQGAICLKCSEGGGE